MTILDYLPGIPRTYWKDYVKAIEPTKPLLINSGERNVQLFPSNLTGKKGLILEFTLSTNNPGIKFNLRIDNRTISATLQQIYDGGYYNYYIPDIPFISEYNTTGNIYVINILGQLPFRNDVYVYADNLTTSPAIINVMGFHAIIFEPGFYKKLAELKNGKED